MKIMKIEEGNLIFDFTGVRAARKLDKQGEAAPFGMSFVDFVVDNQTEVWLVEVKDPSDPLASVESRNKFIRGLKSDEIVNHHLVPKCRDSYTYLHLMKEDGRPLLYAVLIALDNREIERALLLPLKERLTKRLRHEAEKPWERRYVEDCVILDVAAWNETFPWKVSRKSHEG